MLYVLYAVFLRSSKLEKRQCYLEHHKEEKIQFCTVLIAYKWTHAAHTCLVQEYDVWPIHHHKMVVVS